MWIKFLSYNSLIVFSKLISTYIVSKVTAFYLGPSGYALVGNFKNIFQIVIGLTSRGFESGVIKHIAENNDKKEYLKKVISTVILFSLLLSLVASIILFIFSSQLSMLTFKTRDYNFVFRYLAFFLPFISINFLIIYCVNGLQQLKVYAKLISLASIINAILISVLVYYYGLEGALMAIVGVSVISMVLSFLFKEVRYIISEIGFNIKEMSLSIIKSMFIYVIMAAYSTVLMSVVYLLIRTEIISVYNENQAGYWEAVNKISAFYMMFFTSIFTLYLLPNLSKNTTIEGYKNIMTYYFKRLIPLLVVMFILLFLFRFILIKFVLTTEFLAIEKYFVFQFIGDFIKIIAFSLAYQFHAKRMVASYFITDAIIYLSFYGLSLYFLSSFNLQGVFYAHIISSSLYLITVSLFIFTKNKKYLSQNAQ